MEESCKGDDSFFKVVLDAFPSPVFVVDKDMRIIALNDAASHMVGAEADMSIRTRGGEVLHCIHSTQLPDVCGKTLSCKDCAIRNSVSESFQGRKVVRRRTRMYLVHNDNIQEVYLLVTTAPFQYEAGSFVVLILEEIGELIELKRILPICANCKKIRDDQEYWRSVESYFKKHWDVDFTHGLCPDCIQTLYPEISHTKKEE